jgi:hypothetical protein
MVISITDQATTSTGQDPLDPATAFARFTAFSDAYDADLLSQARAIAAAHTIDAMRAFLASKGDSYASGDAMAVYAAFLGRAQAVLSEVANMAARNAGGAR